MLKKETSSHVTRMATSINQSHIQGGSPSSFLWPSLVNYSNIYNNINYLSWRELYKQDKLHLIFQTISPEENFKAFTLRFSDSFMSEAYKNSHSYQEIVDYIRRRISVNLKNKLGYIPDYCFTLEIDSPNNCEDFSQNYKFHIHGIIQANDENFAPIKQALKITAFGKRFKINPMHSQILRMTELVQPIGWFNYITKQNPYMYICQKLIRRAQVFFKNYINLHNSAQII